jgi:putative tryptophan/tyrosine transport system substrate-binding protein
MRRREFITLISGAAVAWPLAARAQQPTMPVVGFLNAASPTELASRTAAFRDGLAEMGYVEGESVTIEYRWGQGQYDRLSELAIDLVRRGVAVIAATGGVASVRAAKTASSAIPIVFTFGGDPVEYGLVASLNRPGGNVTGITLISASVVSKRIALLRDLIPGVKTIAVLMNSSNPGNKAELAVAEQAARTIGWQVRVLRASGKRDFDVAFQPLTRERLDALLVTTDPIFESQRDQIVALAAHHAVPAIYALREYAVAGGLMSYGASITHIYRQAGVPWNSQGSARLKRRRSTPGGQLRADEAGRLEQRRLGELVARQCELRDRAHLRHGVLPLEMPLAVAERKCTGKTRRAEFDPA